jgi:hypothetical protein
VETLLRTAFEQHFASYAFQFPPGHVSCSLAGYREKEPICQLLSPMLEGIRSKIHVEEDRTKQRKPASAGRTNIRGRQRFSHG